jgi:tetratricopeptide (TPR) repeat protein
MAMNRPPIYQATLEKVLEMANRVAAGGKRTPQEDDEYITTFEEYECWSPYFIILSQKLKSKTTSSRETYVRLARVQSLYLEDVFAAAETCAQLVKNLEISFNTFLLEIIPEIVEKDDFASEAAILQAVTTEFSNPADHASCLERLCMLYEKKTYNERQLSASYEKLLEIDRKNVRALRYFKLVYTQSQDWENVARLLQDLMKSVKHQQERFRVAQELATVLLYHLDQPEDSIRVIEAYCAESPLDTTNIQYEAYQRLRDYQGCHRILTARLKKESDGINQAIIYYKLGEVLTNLEKPREATESYEKAALLWQDFLDPIEKLLYIANKAKDWPRILHWLEELKGRLKVTDNSRRVAEAINRITSGLAQRGQ